MTGPLPWTVGDQGVVEGPARSPILVYYSYAPEDASLYAEFEKHLKLLHRHVAVWHAGMAIAGTDVPRQAVKNLAEANIIVVLVTANYLSSDSLYFGELKRAMERHEAGEARLMPVIARSCDWHIAPFANLTPLPIGGTPVALWSDKDEAWTDAAKGIRRGIEELWLKPDT
jgi:hypothetical protein